MANNENGSQVLDKNLSYLYGNFKLILEEDGSLRVIIETNRFHMLIKPSSSNSVILIPTR